MLKDSYEEKYTRKEPSPLEALKLAQRILCNTITEEFDSAVSKNDNENITRYFKLFPKIGEKELGISKFSACVCAVVSKQSRDTMKKLVDDKSHAVYADLLTRLFENIASLVDRQHTIVEMVYGVGWFLEVLRCLMREADIMSGIILDGFYGETTVATKSIK